MGLTEQERMKRRGEEPLDEGWKPNPVVESVLRRGVERAQRLLDEYLARKAAYEKKSKS